MLFATAIVHLLSVYYLLFKPTKVGGEPSDALISTDSILFVAALIGMSILARLLLLAARVRMKK